MVSAVLPRCTAPVPAIVVLLLILVQLISGFPTGAPLSACSHLMPVHVDGELQESAAPYVLILNGTTYGSKPLKLTVSAVGPGVREFMAFMLQARSEFGEPVGRFSGLPPASKVMTCYGQDDTLTHTAAFIRPSMEVLWHPPSKNVGKISITGSIALSKVKFWPVESEALTGTGKLDLSGARGPSRMGHNGSTRVSGDLASWAIIILSMAAFLARCRL